MLLPVKIFKLVVSDIENILEVEEDERESNSEEDDVSYTNNTKLGQVCTWMLHGEGVCVHACART